MLSELSICIVHDKALFLRKVFLLSFRHLAEPSEGVRVRLSKQIQSDHDVNGQLGWQLVIRTLLDSGNASLNERLVTAASHRIVVHNLGDSLQTHVDQVANTNLLESLKGLHVSRPLKSLEANLNIKFT